MSSRRQFLSLRLAQEVLQCNACTGLAEGHRPPHDIPGFSCCDIFIRYRIEKKLGIHVAMNQKLLNIKSLYQMRLEREKMRGGGVSQTITLHHYVVSVVGDTEHER